MAGQARNADFELDDRAFRAALRAAVKDMKLESAHEIEKLGHDVANRAKVYAPVDTGRLRSSIAIQGKGTDGNGSFVDVGTRVKYAAFVEFGTRYMNPQPFMRPALLESVLGWNPRIGH